MTDAATAAQIDAADPFRSTWLSANAGSGKTRVLTNRVARLLLRGTDPRNILCLTYTKAAASEMQNRLFATLGGWAMLGDDKLRKALGELGEPEPYDLIQARTLFARAIEVPGGLRIQTIHALCASILRQFPLEGGVSPQFREMEEADQVRLIEEVLEDLAKAGTPELAAMAALHSGDTLVPVAKSVAARAENFAVECSREDIFGYFGISPTLTEQDIHDQAFEDGDLEFLRGFLVPLPDVAGPNDTKLAAKLAGLPMSQGREALEILGGALLNGPNTKNPLSSKAGTIPTKKTRDDPEVQPKLDRFNSIIDRVETGFRAWLSLDAALRTEALHRFAGVFLPAYAAAKQAHSALDFDDLIRKARDVLSSRALAWILYRLDGRIDHILVDEAQDTSPAQWHIVQSLTDAMADNSNRARTLFVVGDKKQSIYSFQGADAEGFDRNQQVFDDQLQGGLRSRELLHSFRSSTAILSLVDAVSDPLDGLGDMIKHYAFHAGMPGRVDLWPLIAPPEDPEELEWHDPRDRPVANAASVQLGQMIAEQIERLLETETIQDKNGPFRPVRPGDIMILVQRRSQIFDQIIQACKAKGLAIAGADKLKIGDELAVRDLLALLSFLTLPEDDLSLAATLRSPLFGLSEAELYGLAAHRSEDSTLWDALVRQKDDFTEPHAMLERLRRSVDVLRPFELLERILSDEGGRVRLLARLGPEAEDGIDELLKQALHFERDAIPSVTGFLARMQSEDIEIKRSPGTDDDLIRVMTVHGAKGLERPIVILPDTTSVGNSRAETVVIGDDGFPMGHVASKRAIPPITDAKQTKKDASLDERNRLLYVAMTRAERWLIVGGAAPKKTSEALNWYKAVAEGMKRAGAGPCETPPGTLRLQFGDWPDALSDPREMPSRKDVAPLADFLRVAAADSTSVVRPVSPSNLKGAKVLPGETSEEDQALKRGRQIHLLLEHLPGQDDPDAVGKRLLSVGADRATPEEMPELIQQALKVLDLHPSIFGAGTLAEVDVSAHLSALDHPMSGKIDRLIVTPVKVEALDYKTNRIVPETPEQVPEGLKRQMGAYLEALEAIFPDRQVDVSILWTETCTRMVLPHAIVRQALQRATIS